MRCLEQRKGGKVDTGRRRRQLRAGLLALAGAAALALVVSCTFPDSLDAVARGNGHGHHYKPPATTDTLQLSWNANTETNLAGYKLYMGTSSGIYGSPTLLGLVTTTNVSTLTPGTTYYFALAAFNSSGQESAKTAELSYLAP